MVVKSRSGKEDQSRRHRFDKVLVWAMDLMGRRKRMWWRTASGKSPIRSSPPPLSALFSALLKSLFLLADHLSLTSPEAVIHGAAKGTPAKFVLSYLRLTTCEHSQNSEPGESPRAANQSARKRFTGCASGAGTLHPKS
ncbi:hypothetical protein U1Q18_029153 [Sarracenia purpurea var. burkii]